MTQKRRQMILDLISSRNISTQTELKNLLEVEGIKVTQATLSRDIAKLGIIKTDSGYIPAKIRQSELEEEKAVKILYEAIHNVDYTANILVVNTLVGMGSAAGAALDNLKLPGIIGSVAGDDTVIMIAKTPEDTKAAYDKVRSLTVRHD